MDLLLRYLKQRWRIYAVFLLFSLVFYIIFLLQHIHLAAAIYPTLLCVLIGILFSAVDFRRVSIKHQKLKYVDSMIDVIENDFPQAEGIIEDDYQEIINFLGEEHNRWVTSMNKEYTDMVDYYTVWAHQIKTPIASMRLNLQNEDSALARKLNGDLYRIEQYVEMVLTFIRLNSESSDYVIKEYDLDTIVKQVVKKLSHDFIGRKISLIYEPLNTKVITDEKWLSFVIEQVLSNALKYTNAGSITITIDKDKKLFIKDTGIGIAPEDLPRIFENGYTGFNGRVDKKASGIGLYLCKRICSNLGHNIAADSVLDEGTIITIDLARQKLEVE